MLNLLWGPCTAWRQAVCQCFEGTCGQQPVSLTTENSDIKQLDADYSYCCYFTTTAIAAAAATILYYYYYCVMLMRVTYYVLVPHASVLLQELLSIKILQVGVTNPKLQAITPLGIYTIFCGN
jgi:hypothetical protein